MRILLVVVVLLLVPGLARAFQNEPHGFGKARFGMSVDEVKEVLPDMKEVGNPSPESAALLAVYKLENQTVLGLKHCSVSLQFDPKRLYQITFDCGSGTEVPAKLQRQFGDPTHSQPNNAFWASDAVAISLNTKSRNFAFVDRKLNDGFQHRLGQYVMQQQLLAKSATPAPDSEATPAATPQ